MFGKFKLGLVQLSFHEEPCDAAFIPECPIMSRLIVLSANRFFSPCDNPVASLNNCVEMLEMYVGLLPHTLHHFRVGVQWKSLQPSP